MVGLSSIPISGHYCFFHKLIYVDITVDKNV